MFTFTQNGFLSNERKWDTLCAKKNKRIHITHLKLTLVTFMRDFLLIKLFKCIVMRFLFTHK